MNKNTLNNFKGNWLPPLDSRIYIGFSLISLILLFFSIWQIKPIIVNIDDFLGLVSHLTIAYWIGFIIIIFFSIRLYLEGTKGDYIYLIYLIMIGLYFFAVPVFAEDNARYPWSYYPAGEVKNILEKNKIDIGAKYPVLSYRSWPATHFISAFILYSTNVKVEDLVKYMPIFWIIFTIFTIFSVGKRIKLSADQSFMLTLLLISSFWSFHYYYGPQSMVYLLYLSLFLLVIGLDNIKNIVLTLMIFSVMVMTHMLTSIAMVYSSMATSKFLIHKNRTKFIFLLIIIFAAWYVFMASSMFKIGVREFIAQATNAEIFNFINTGKYEEGTLLTRQITHYARLSYLGIYGIFMSISIGLYMADKIIKENKNLIKISLYWLLGILALFMFKYGEAEIDDRVYILALLPMALILVSSFNKKVLIIISILLMSLHIPAHYGSESYDQASTTELKGAEFFAINIPNNEDRYSYYYSAYIRFYEPKKIFMKWTSFTGLGKPNISILDKAKYIIDSDKNYDFMMYAHGFDPIKEWMKTDKYNLNMLYDNGYFKIYEK